MKTSSRTGVRRRVNAITIRRLFAEALSPYSRLAERHTLVPDTDLVPAIDLAQMYQDFATSRNSVSCHVLLWGDGTKVRFFHSKLISR